MILDGSVERAQRERHSYVWMRDIGSVMQDVG